MAPYDYIKKEIILGNFEAGSVFDEAKVAKELNLSRTPVREAVLRLQSEGYLTIIPRKGTLVSNISITDIKEVYQYRMILECNVIKELDNINIDLLNSWKIYFNKLINEDYTNLVLPVEKDSIDDIDKLFHLSIIGLLNNKLINKEETLLMDKSARIRYVSNKNNKRYIDSLKEHISIIDALLNKDLDKASKLMKEHLLNSLRGYNL